MSGELPLFFLTSEYTAGSLTNTTRLIAATYSGSTPTTSRCGYGCSDHASARSNGFRKLPAPLARFVLGLVLTE